MAVWSGMASGTGAEASVTVGDSGYYTVSICNKVLGKDKIGEADDTMIPLYTDKDGDGIGGCTKCGEICEARYKYMMSIGISPSPNTILCGVRETGDYDEEERVFTLKDDNGPGNRVVKDGETLHIVDNPNQQITAQLTGECFHPGFKSIQYSKFPQWDGISRGGNGQPTKTFIANSSGTLKCSAALHLDYEANVQIVGKNKWSPTVFKIDQIEDVNEKIKKYIEKTPLKNFIPKIEMSGTVNGENVDYYNDGSKTGIKRDYKINAGGSISLPNTGDVPLYTVGVAKVYANLTFGNFFLVGSIGALKDQSTPNPNYQLDGKIETGVRGIGLTICAKAGNDYVLSLSGCGYSNFNFIIRGQPVLKGNSLYCNLTLQPIQVRIGFSATFTSLKYLSVKVLDVYYDFDGLNEEVQIKEIHLKDLD